jgi:EAL and modified HD-GYP domain-containing signal transduction protein
MRTTALAEAERVSTEGIGYLARQPILDRRGSVFGYELHFHGAPARTGKATGSKGVEALSLEMRTVLDSLALYGVERFTGGTWGFVPCGLDVLESELLEGLPAALTVLEIPPCTDVSPGLVRECMRLRERGFWLALSDFEAQDPRQSLLRLVQYVKVDIDTIESQEWPALSDELHRCNAFLVVENVHSHETYRKARAGGRQYFQGYYFCNPELFPNGAVPADRTHYLEILRDLFKDPLDLKTLCPLVARDPSLVYRVLRFVNSPICAVRNAVTSIEMAIMILGDNVFRRIAMLAIQCTLSKDESQELLRMAQIRARFCSEAAALCGLDAEEMYLVGMLSLLPAMLRVPMQTIVPNLPLRKPICDALAGSAVRERCLLAWIEALEVNDIAECEEIAAGFVLAKDRLAQLYLDAVHDVALDAVLI